MYAARECAGMKTLGKLFFRGLAAILPLALTGYLVWAAVAAAETVLQGLVEWAIRTLDLDWQYRPGMGFAVSIVLVLLVGMLTYSLVMRTIYHRFTSMIRRIPVVKSIFAMIVDVVQLFGGERKPMQRVVLVRLAGGGEVLGFLTRDDFSDLPAFGTGRVAVFVPMSYQLGGFTLIVARDQVREVPMQAEEALRFCVTAGVAHRQTA
jgi:uncharacterized membrane protein